MIRVLLIDDDELFLWALPAMLKQSAPTFTFHMAKTAEHALRLLQLTDYDAIVSDFSMPAFNGIDFLKECKITRPDIPIILLTGYATNELEAEALEQGAYAIVQKPVEAEEFVSVVSRAVLRREVLRAGLVDGALFAKEQKRVSSRLKEINDLLKSKIQDYEKGQS